MEEFHCAERSAHRWRPAPDARITKRPRRAAIRWSARFGMAVRFKLLPQTVGWPKENGEQH